MKINSTNLLIQINETNHILAVVDYKDNNNFKVVYHDVYLQENSNERTIVKLNENYQSLKKNIYAIEKKLKTTFNEVSLILNIKNCKILNFSGFKKLNSSQLTKENVIYILNSLKSKVNEIEENKTIIQIFNSNYLLDNKKTVNLPIGLFGNLYSQELSFLLMDKNDHKNLENIFDKCNLRIKKFISKSFIDGVNLMNKNSDFETFLKLIINKNNSQIFFFENGALKFIQSFNFGTNLILNDITKILSIDKNMIEKFISSFTFDKNLKDDNYLDQKYFLNQNFRKIKKKLILEVASARIQELSEITIFNNINVFNFLERKVPIYLEVSDKNNLKCFFNAYEIFFSKSHKYDLQLLEGEHEDEIFRTALSIVHFGWNKEAVPIVQSKKSLISRFFDFLFN